MLAMTFDRRTMLRVQLFAPEIQEAIAKTLLFRDLLRAGDLERQRLGGRQHLDAVDDDLDEAGRQRGIDVLVGAGDHAAGDARSRSRA